MINFETLFKNHLSNKEISMNELQLFSEDHVQRITANNPANILDPIVAPTAAAHIAYFGALSNKDVAKSVQQALTVTVNNKMAEFQQTVTRKAPFVEAAYGKDGAAYQEFFPHGLTEYSHATMETVELLMERMVTACTAHAADLPVGLAGVFEAIQTAFVTARSAQLGKKGNVADNADTARTLRTTLELQLVANIHFIGYKYPGNVSQCMAYFDQSILNEDSSGTGGGGDDNTFSGTLAAGEVKVIATVTYAAGRSVQMENTGSTPIIISLNLVPAGAPEADKVTLMPGEQQTRTMQELNDNPEAVSLQVKNTDGVAEGAYTVSLS